MRLHRLRLRNYRGVADCTVEFRTDGVTIIEGDNEVGKTCIPEALKLILSALDSSKSKQVRDITPVGSDEGPVVEVEITTGDYRFVYWKRWHRRPATTLKITSPRPENHEGREAHERVEAILAETLDANLWKALQIQQGAAPGLPGFLDVGSLGQALDKAAATLAGGTPVGGAAKGVLADNGAPAGSVTQVGTPAGGDEDDLWQRICDERARYWTPTGQVNQERKSLQAEVEQSRAAVTELEQQLRAIDHEANEVARLQDDAARLEAAHAESEKSQQDLQTQWDATERLRGDVESLQASFNLAGEKRERAAADWQRRQNLIDALAARRFEFAELETDAQQAAPSLATAVDRNRQATADLEVAVAAHRVAEARHRLATDDRDHHRKQIELAQLRERYERVVAAQVVLSATEAHLQAARVDDVLLERIQEAQDARLAAEAAATVGAATVEASALAAFALEVDGRNLELAAGASEVFRVSDEVEITVPEVVTIKVRAGAGSRDLAAELEAAASKLKQLCIEGGVADLFEARQAAENRREAQRQRAAALKTIQQDLRDLTPDVLQQKVEGLARGIATYAEQRPANLAASEAETGPGRGPSLSTPVTPPLPADFEAAKRVVDNTKRELADRQEASERSRNAAARAAADLQDLQRREAGLTGRIETAGTARDRATAELEAAREERSDAELQAALVASQHEATAAGVALEEAEAELADADPASLKIRLGNAGDTVARSQDDLQKNQTRLQELRISLEVRGEQGLAAGLDEALSKCRHVEREYESLQARARAAELLYTTFEKRRRETRQRYVAPFKDRIEQYGRIVFGSDFAVELDDNLRVARRTHRGITLDVDRLSVGAREQIGVLVRLACAAIVSPDGGGAPVVIDDALGWSDPTRLRDMGAAISTAGKECQVIILTCTPGRYHHVGNAKTVQLPN